MFEAQLRKAAVGASGRVRGPSLDAVRAWRKFRVVVSLPEHGLERIVSLMHGFELASALTAHQARSNASTETASGLEPEDLLLLAQGWQKVTCFAQAQQRLAVGRLALSRMPAAFRDDVSAELNSSGDVRQDDTVEDTREACAPAGRRFWVPEEDTSAHEIAFVLGCSVRAADVLVGESLAMLTDLPETLDALTRGRITVQAAQAIVTETAHVARPLRHAAEQTVLPSPGDPDFDRSPTQLRAATRRAVVRADPTAARRRETAARGRRCVRTSSDLDGMAGLHVHGPVAQVAFAFDNIDSHARHLAAQPGEERGIEALRTDLTLDALMGLIHLGAPGCTPDPASGEPPGPFAGPTTDAVDPATGALYPVPERAAAEASPRRCRSPRVRAEIVVTGADTTLAGLDDDPGELAGYGPITAHTLRELTARAAAVDALTVDSGTGAVTTVTPVPTPDATDSPRLETTVLLRATALVSAARAVASTATPPQACRGYTPSVALARLVIARDRTCRFPRCRRRAVRCDLDHALRYPDGPTCSANLGPLCRRHHRLKHSPGWQLEQPTPGTFTWTTPTRRRYTVEPPDPLDPE